MANKKTNRNVHIYQEKFLRNYQVKNLSKKSHNEFFFFGTELSTSKFYFVRSVCIETFSGMYFPASGLNLKIYIVNLPIQPKCRKIQTTKTQNMDTFTYYLLHQDYLPSHSLRALLTTLYSINKNYRNLIKKFLLSYLFWMFHRRTANRICIHLATNNSLKGCHFLK